MESKGWRPEVLPLRIFSCPSETPLTLAAQTEGSVEVIRTLCLGGAHIDFRARDGMTALHKAACARHCLALTVRLLESPEGDPFSFPFSSISVQKIPCQPGLKYMPAILALRDPRLARLRETLSHCPPVQTVPLCPHHTIGFCTLTDTQFCQSVRCPGLV